MEDDGAAMDSDRVDFLVATALRDEYDAFVAELPGCRLDGLDTIASIPRVDSTDSYRIAVIVTGQTNAVAQQAVSNAIARRDPGAVILIGIAAGFPESGVALGDVLVPFHIAPYEYAKISEQPVRADARRRNSATTPASIAHEHRNLPFDVSHPLWEQAEALSRNPLRPWLKRLHVSRPPSSKPEPAIHADRRFVLGSGDKLVASDLAEARRWLIQTFGDKAKGLEMEAYGVLMACRSRNVPFLVVKAAQDPGLATKDDPATKDEWRAYAARISAAFVLSLIESFPSPGLVRKERELRSAIPSCFVNATEEFTAAISRNFLFEFDGKDSDYVQLLSPDLRRVFFHEFNEKLRSGIINRIVFSGREGSGKTFNALLLSLQLSRESYRVYYCDDITAGNLRKNDLKEISRSRQAHTLFLIDNIQDDLLKAADLVAAISHQGSYKDQPLFLFLNQPIDQQTFLDTFGLNTPIVTMVDKFVDFERLVTLFFNVYGRPDAAKVLLKNEDAVRLSGVAWTYRNMAFWNEILRSLLEDESLILTEERILARAHSFLRKREPELFTSREALSRLLPLFSQGIRVHVDYVQELLGYNADSLVGELEQQGIIRILEQDWSKEPDQYGYTSVLVVAPRLHVTKAKLLARILGRYYGYTADQLEATIKYSERFPVNLHYTLATFHNPDDFRLAFTSSRIQSITRQYLLNRHVGRQLDFMIRRIAVLDETTRNIVLNGDVLDELARKIGDQHVYLVSKVYLLRTLYRLEPEKAFRVFQKLKPDALTASFIADSAPRSIVPLAKAFEILKNIYLAVTIDARASVQLFARQVIDECRSEFMKRLTKYDPYFTQLHWILKRLKGLRLDSYFLEGVAPDLLVELIRTKDTSIGELSRLLFSSASTLQVAADGLQRSYCEILKEKLTYDDLKKICDNKRSNLSGLSISATRDEFVAKALMKYVDEPNFKRKVSAKKQRSYHRSAELIGSSRFLKETEKRHILRALEAAFAATSGR